MNALPKLRIGIPGDYLPFGIIDGNTPEGFSGHDVDLAVALCREAGLSPVFVLSSWPALMPELAAGRFDVAVGGVSWNADRVRRFDDLPRYAPFAKVALIRRAEAERFRTPEDLNRPDVHVIKNPGGTNEQFVDEHLFRCRVTTVADNASIPARIASEVGDVMITDSFEARWYAARDVRLTLAMNGRHLTPEGWKTFLVRRGAHAPALPVPEGTPAPRTPLLTGVLLRAWGRLERAGEIERLARRWLGA